MPNPEPWYTHADVFTALITGAYTIVSFLQWLAVRGQLKVLQRQTDIAVNSARAWITVSTDFQFRLPDYSNQGMPELSQVLVTLQNSGGSPAEC